MYYFSFHLGSSHYAFVFRNQLYGWRPMRQAGGKLRFKPEQILIDINLLLSGATPFSQTCVLLVFCLIVRLMDVRLYPTKRRGTFDDGIGQEA